MPRNHRADSDRNPAGQADLAAMSMATQQKIKAGKGSLPIDFWRVRK